MHHADTCDVAGHFFKGEVGDFASLSAVQLVSFADSSFKKSLGRLRRQAVSFGFTRAPRMLTERDLAGEVLEQALSQWGILGRGYGFYFWKPQVILQELERLGDGEILIYLDAGCHLNLEGRERMKDYLRWVSESETGLLAFQYRPLSMSVHNQDREFYTDRQYSKKLVRDFLSVSGSSREILDSGQVASGIILVRKNQASVDTITAWRDAFLCEPKLFDDSPGPLPEEPDFIEHRHDQSVWSLLLKLRGGETVSAFERWVPKKGPHSQDWSLLAEFPFWAKRDLALSLKPMLMSQSLRLGSASKRLFRTRTPQKPEGLA